jgi:hypothetical protein
VSLDIRQRRILHDRNLALEVQRSQLYEELRQLSDAELHLRAGEHGTRQVLIALIIETECPHTNS